MRWMTLLVGALAVWVVSAAGASGSAGAVQARWVVRDLGIGGSEALAVNERGQVLGRSATGGFLWQNGRVTDLGDVSPVALNDLGQIIWQQNTPTGQHVFLWEKGSARDIGTLGGPGSFPVAINDLGQIVGYADTAADSVHLTGPAHVFLWENGVMSDLGTDCWAKAINDKGQIAGRTLNTGTGDFGCLLDHGTTTGFGTPGGSQSDAYAINERGQVIGYISTATGAYHAYVWQNGKMTDLGTLGGQRTFPTAINGRGQIIGQSDTPRFPEAITDRGKFPRTFNHAFVWQKGKMTDLGTLPGGKSSTATAINDRGQIVGYASTATRTNHAFLWENGKMTDLGTLPRYQASRAVAINNKGQIVGYTTKTGQRHAVLWTLRHST